MPTKIQLRRDAAADWTSNNPTLAAGEFGWESDSNRFKIGDGSTAWASLAYADTLKTFGDLSVTGSTISAPSDGDLTLTTSGSGIVYVNDSFKIGSGATVTTILDEDAMGSNSATSLATQQSIKAYVDANAGGDLGDISFNGSTISSPSNADITLTPGGTGGVVASALRINGTTISSDDSATININDGLNVDGTANVEGALTASTSLNIASDGATVTGIKDEDDMASDSATKLATQQSIKAYVDNEIANVSVGDLSFVGSTIASPSNADLTLNSSNGNVVIEGIRVAGTTISTEDSSPGIEIAGNLIPSADGIYANIGIFNDSLIPEGPLTAVT